MSTRIQGVTEKVYNGVKYRSTLEANTAEMLDKLGIPFRYEKVRYTLLESFRTPFQKDMVRSIKYTPDFFIGDTILIECKGFETPEWKQKKKYIFKYLMENEPDVVFHQTSDCKRSLLEALDMHFSYLGLAVQVTSKGTKRNPPQTITFDSVKQAMEELDLTGKPVGSVLRSLIGEADHVYGYNWKLVPIEQKTIDNLKQEEHEQHR